MDILYLLKVVNGRINLAFIEMEVGGVYNIKSFYCVLIKYGLYFKYRGVKIV